MKKITKQAIHLTRELIKIASESSDPTVPYRFGPEYEIVSCLQKICTDNGIPWRLQEALPGRYNFIAFFQKENAPKLLVLAHMDTVSANGVANPFGAKVSNGKIYGRGACDDKGPLATALSTLLGLFQEKKVLHYDVTFVATVDEECSMSGAANFAKECGSFDLCLAMEPTNLRLINGHKGVYRGQITCKGKASHSSTPELGDNAILTMHTIINDLIVFGRDLQKSTNPFLGHASLAITQISGGTVINIIPESCKISIDVRILPEHSPKSIASSLKDIIAERGKLRKIFAANAIYSEPDNKEISRLAKTLINKGCDATPTTVSYATDCSKLTKKGPCIVWGPGDIKQAHQSEEFIEISQIEKGCQIFAEFLAEK